MGSRALVGLTLLLLAVTGCGGTGASSNSGQGGGIENITVGVAAVDPVYADTYAAEAKGFFKKAGVNVTVIGAGANGLNMVTAGQLDLLGFGLGQALVLASKGKPTTIVYDLFGAGVGGALVVLNSRHYTSLTDLSGKRVAVLGVGGASYGFGQIYSNYSASHGGAKFNLISVGSSNIIVDGLVSGQFDAAVATLSWFGKQLSDGTVSVLVDPSKPDAKKYVGDPYPEAGYFGSTDTVKAKKEAIIRFLAAIRATDNWLHSASAEEVAQVLRQNPALSAISVDTITLGVKLEKPYFAPSLGNISEADWKSALNHMSYWGIPDLDLASPVCSYSNRVDMSYLREATNRKIAFNG